ncbi:hypothetical protein, partial [Klebsiella pneumoniae]
FSYLKAMYHQSKIQAELKAQIHEQTTVNAICHHPESIEIIAVCSTDAYYGVLSGNPRKFRHSV